MVYTASDGEPYIAKIREASDGDDKAAVDALWGFARVEENKLAMCNHTAVLDALSETLSRAGEETRTSAVNTIWNLAMNKDCKVKASSLLSLSIDQCVLLS
jgi:hypothetical protein